MESKTEARILVVNDRGGVKMSEWGARANEGTGASQPHLEKGLACVDY
jgi:hypothetical protein